MMLTNKEAIELIEKYIERYYGLFPSDAIKALDMAIEALQQVTGKLRNPDDSLLTADSEACKEQKSKLDLISRQDAIKVLNDRQYDIRAFIEKENMEYKESHSYWCEIHGIYNSIELIESLPSATSQSLTKPNKSCEDDLISRQGAIDAIRKFQTYKLFKKDNMLLVDQAEVMTELMMLPSAPDSRQRGEWVRLEREENVYDLHGVPTWGVNYMCDKCGFITTAIQDHFAQYKWCPSCGADMRGGEDE